jgi:hypothetical protein
LKIYSFCNQNFTIQVFESIYNPFKKLAGRQGFYNPFKKLAGRQAFGIQKGLIMFEDCKFLDKVLFFHNQMYGDMEFFDNQTMRKITFLTDSPNYKRSSKYGNLRYSMSNLNHGGSV